MKKRNTLFNTKRKIHARDPDFLRLCEKLAKKVNYGGNPEHKKNPGDFGLTPPSGPRKGKSLCDDCGVFTRESALKYLRSGLMKGLVSEQFNGEWPQNIWAVMTNGMPLEAQLENSILGTYHGYPIPSSDPFGDEVIKQWGEPSEKF